MKSSRPVRRKRGHSFATETLAPTRLGSAASMRVVDSPREKEFVGRVTCTTPALIRLSIHLVATRPARDVWLGREVRSWERANHLDLRSWVGEGAGEP